MTKSRTDIEWRDVPEFQGLYQASYDGQIRNARSGRLRKQKACKRGYLWIGVSNGRGSSRNVSVARMVCSAFHGGIIAGLDVDHINRVRSDNRASNLRWVTRSENLANRVTRSGEAHHKSRLTDVQVRQIRATPHEIGLDRRLAAQLGVARETVRDIRLGKERKYA